MSEEAVPPAAPVKQFHEMTPREQVAWKRAHGFSPSIQEAHAALATPPDPKPAPAPTPRPASDTKKYDEMTPAEQVAFRRANGLR